MTEQGIEPAAVRVHGAVARAATFTLVDLEALPHLADLSRVAAAKSGRAVRVEDLLDAVEPLAAATHLTAISRDGSYRASIPLSDAAASGWVAFATAGATAPGNTPLPTEQGGPFRLTVAEGRTLCWNVKDVAELQLTIGPEPDDVPEAPPH
jgi:DMSO/TMAO reductase YedYZ molybdopterin-dependent catalytic subunit